MQSEEMSLRLNVVNVSAVLTFYRKVIPPLWGQNREQS